MAVSFTDEQQEYVNNLVADTKRKAEKKYEGFLSPEDVAGAKTGYEKQIGELTSALEAANKKAAGHEKEIADRDSRIKAYETASLKSRVAHETGLSYDAIGFLSGDDEESIRKSADSLKSLIGARRTAPDVSNEPAVTNNSATSEAIRKLARSIGQK